MKYRPSFSKIRDTVRNTDFGKGKEIHKSAGFDVAEKKHEIAKKMETRKGFTPKTTHEGKIDWSHYQKMREDKKKKGLIN